MRECHTVVYARPTPAHGVPSGRPKLTTNAEETMGEEFTASTTETVEVALKAPARMVCAHGTIPAVQLLLCAIKSCA